MSDDSDDDPFTCPVCGGGVRCSGNGAKDCTECPWDFRPTRDTQETTKQVGITNY